MLFWRHHAGARAEVPTNEGYSPSSSVTLWPLFSAARWRKKEGTGWHGRGHIHHHGVKLKTAKNTRRIIKVSRHSYQTAQIY